MEKKHREKIHNTGKTQGILSRLECGYPEFGTSCKLSEKLNPMKHALKGSQNYKCG